MKVAIKRFTARIFLVLLVVTSVGCQVARNLLPRTYTSSVSPDGLHTASVWRASNLDPPDDHLFLTSGNGPARRLMDLAPDADWCRTIIWTPNSRKVGFVISDDRLAVFDVGTGTLEAFFFLAGSGCCGGPLESRNVGFNESGTEVAFDRFARPTVLITEGDGARFEAHVTRESLDGPLMSRPLLRPATNLGREVVRVPVSRIRVRLLTLPGRPVPRRITVAVVGADGRRIEIVGEPASDGLTVLPAVTDGPIDRLEVGFNDGTGKRTVVRGVETGDGETAVSVPPTAGG
jgi:hypothetical protein